MTLSAIITTAVAIPLIMTITILQWNHKHTKNFLIHGSGLSLIILGLLFLGITELVIQGILGLVNWIKNVVWNNLMTAGAIITVTGILTVVIGSLIIGATKNSSSTKKPHKINTKQKQNTKAINPSLDQEDQEIEALLNKRGIK